MSKDPGLGGLLGGLYNILFPKKYNKNTRIKVVFLPQSGILNKSIIHVVFMTMCMNAAKELIFICCGFELWKRRTTTCLGVNSFNRLKPALGVLLKAMQNTHFQVPVRHFCANPLSVPSCHGRLACPARHMPMGRTENPRIRLISAPLSLKIRTIDT